MNQLIPIESVNAIELFDDIKVLTTLLNEIKISATDFEPDVTTDKGRKEIASQAYKVRRSKTVIDNAGKDQTDEWRSKTNKVNTGRKYARDFCDALCDEITEPLDAYKEEQAALVALAALRAEKEADEIAAYERNDLIDREAKVKAFELQQAAAEAERQRIEQERLAAKVKEEQLEQIRINAEKKAKQDAADELQAAKDETARLEQERLDALAREKARIAQVEQDKKDATRDAAQAAEAAHAAQQAAIALEQKRAKDEAQRVERERLKLIDQNEREAQARARDTENRRMVDNLIIDALVAGGVSKAAAKKTVTLIAGMKIPRTSIRY